ncbi:MAG: hypothetical protein GXP26_02910 [Planctomycetes bacterium]|nr:hypothetical protein [Planctomycetota bacterium]
MCCKAGCNVHVGLGNRCTPFNRHSRRGSRYYLNLLVLYQGQRVESVVIMPRLATLESLSSSSPPSVPVSMLVRLIQSVRRLWPLCHLSERPLVRSIDVTVGELLRRSPFYAEIINYLESQSSSVPCGYSRDEYREMTLRTLWEQLELTAAVAEKMGADINLSVSGVLQLMANYVGFVPASLDQALPVEKVPYH